MTFAKKMEEELQQLLDGLKDPYHPTWDVDTIALNGRYGVFHETPLHVFAVRGDYRACKCLVDAGADLNVPGEHGYTPLHEAVHQGHVAIVELFLQHGADSTLPTAMGTTEFLAEEYPEIVALLQKKANKAEMATPRKPSD